MFIEAKKLLNLPIAALDVQGKIGEIKKIIIDPTNGNVLGFLIQTGGVFSAKKVIASLDIREWDTNGLVTESIENLIEQGEIIRIKEILDEDFSLIGLKAKTESGKNLGQVEDFLIDTENQCVVKYYLKDLLGKKRVLSYDRVIKIDKEIIFSDDVSEPTNAANALA